MKMHRYVDVKLEGSQYVARPNFEVQADEEVVGEGQTALGAIQDLEIKLMGLGIQKGSYEFRMFATGSATSDMRRIKIEDKDGRD